MQSRIRPNHLGIFVYVFVGTRMFEICKQYLYYTYLRINTVCGKSQLSTEAVKKMWLMQHIIVALLKKNKKSVVLSTGIGNFWNIYIHTYMHTYVYIPTAWFLMKSANKVRHPPWPLHFAPTETSQRMETLVLSDWILMCGGWACTEWVTHKHISGFCY